MQPVPEFKVKLEEKSSPTYQPPLSEFSLPRAATLCAAGMVLLTTGCADRYPESIRPVAPISAASVLSDKSLLGKEVTLAGDVQLVKVGVYSTSWWPASPFERREFTYWLTNGTEQSQPLPLLSSTRLAEGRMEVHGVVSLQNGKQVLTVKSAKQLE